MSETNLWLIENGFGIPVEAFILGLFIGWCTG